MKKGILILIAVVVLITSSFTVASSEISNKENELGKIESEIKDLDKKIREKESSKKQIVKDVDSLNDNIRSLGNEIGNINDSITDYKMDIAELNTNIENTTLKLEAKTEIFYERLRVMYKSKNVGYFEIIFGAKDFEDLLTRIDMIRLLVQHDTELINTLNEEKQYLEEAKMEVGFKKNELEDSKTNLAGKQTNLNQQADLLEDTKKQLLKDLDALETQVDRLNDDANSLTKLIENLKLEAKYVGGVMTWPTPGIYRITSPFGYRIHPILNTKKLHTGIDIGVPKGTKVVAAQSGHIIYSDWYGGYGLVVMIDHGGGIVTLYGHNSKLIAKVGQYVEKGQNISLSGSTGLSTGPHLHFEVRVDGQYIDPLTYVTAQ
ncbi:MAG: peptidoglycan DD-metalloendopeptidase family protein [Clostridiales bacterium]|nr:peptidoglycan DD-metalloendopeptidase family protein [Clostridiales bacterium]